MNRTVLTVFGILLICVTPVLIAQGEMWITWMIIGFFTGGAFVAVWRDSPSQPAPEGADEGETSMLRAIVGYPAGLVSIVMSYIIVAALAVVLVFPQTRTMMIVPEMLGGGSLYDLVYAILYKILIPVWIGSALLAGRWVPKSLQAADRFSSKFAFLGILAIAIWLAFAAWTYNEFTRGDGLLLITVLAFAFLDWWYAKSDDFYSSALKGEVARLEAQLATIEAEKADLANAVGRLTRELDAVRGTTPTLSVVGPHMPFVKLLEVSIVRPARIELPPFGAPNSKKTYVVLGPDGHVDFDTDYTDADVDRLLADEVSRRNAAATATAA